MLKFTSLYVQHKFALRRRHLSMIIFALIFVPFKPFVYYFFMPLCVAIDSFLLWLFQARTSLTGFHSRRNWERETESMVLWSLLFFRRLMLCVWTRWDENYCLMLLTLLLCRCERKIMMKKSASGFYFKNWIIGEFCGSKISHFLSYNLIAAFSPTIHLNLFPGEQTISLQFSSICAQSSWLT